MGRTLESITDPLTLEAGDEVVLACAACKEAHDVTLTSSPVWPDSLRLGGFITKTNENIGLVRDYTGHIDPDFTEVFRVVAADDSAFFEEV